jgi:hypothetical protein
VFLGTESMDHKIELRLSIIGSKLSRGSGIEKKAREDA